MDKNLLIACVHVLDGENIYHQSEGHILCEECFNHYNSYGHDENGHWKVPKNEDFSNLVTVCKSCVNEIIHTKNKKIRKQWSHKKT